MKNASSPVAWARWLSIAELMARTLEPRQPPVLVVSLPRSGSSWVGEALGASQEALYLREPITQSHLASSDSNISVFLVSPEAPPASYQAFADTAFLGLPAFGPNIVKRPAQWSLLRRRQRRVVIKDVNPLALGWLAERYQPRIVFLVRHPAAVANSYLKLGWSDVQFANRIPASEWEKLRDKLPPLDDFWMEHAAFQGYVTRKALDMLETYANVSLVRYEDLCEDPLRKFQEIYAFAGLEWTDDIARLVETRSKGSGGTDSSADPYSTARDSKSQIFSWRKNVQEAEIAKMGEVYASFGLPFYTDSVWW